MGQSVSAIREEAKKQNEEAEKMANDSLTALQDIAKLQVQLFKAQVTSVQPYAPSFPDLD